jgi:tetratricopeptide (TPR) repeat protein
MLTMSWRALAGTSAVAHGTHATHRTHATLRLMAHRALHMIPRLKKFPSLVAVAVIFSATLVVYAPGLRNGFVWDDTALVLRDPLIRSWRLIPEAFGHFLFLDATASDFYRPLQRLTFMADYALYGFGAPWGWHLTSTLIHAAAAVALFFLARKFESHGWALALAVLWAVHPVHTSAVTYIAGRADPLAALFGFNGLALGFAALEGRALSRPTLALAALCFLGALLSKESGVGFLIVWLLVLLWRRAGWKAVGAWCGLLAAVLGVYCALRFSAERTPPPASPPTLVTIRPILAARALAEYAGLLALPRNLRMERDVTTAPQATYEATVRNARLREYQTLLGVLLAVALGAWWRWASRRERAAVLWLTAAGLAWLPVSNLFSLNATVAEHWIYVPSAFLFLAAALSLRLMFGVWCLEFGVGEKAGAENSKLQTPNSKLQTRIASGVAALLGVWVCGLGARTWLRQPDWRDQRTFLERTIAAGGDSARMRMNLGNLEFNEGRPALALAHYETALQRAPDLAMAWLALAQVSLRTGDLDRAKTALAQAEGSPLLAAEVLLTRAAIEQVETGRDTTDLYRQAVALQARNWPTRKRYLAQLDRAGRTAEAARDLRDFLREQRFRAESWTMLAGFLEKLGQADAAAAARAEAALRDVRLADVPPAARR